MRLYFHILVRNLGAKPSILPITTRFSCDLTHHLPSSLTRDVQRDVRIYDLINDTRFDEIPAIESEKLFIIVHFSLILLRARQLRAHKMIIFNYTARFRYRVFAFPGESICG